MSPSLPIALLIVVRENQGHQVSPLGWALDAITGSLLATRAIPGCVDRCLMHRKH